MAIMCAAVHLDHHTRQAYRLSLCQRRFAISGRYALLSYVGLLALWRTRWGTRTIGGENGDDPGQFHFVTDVAQAAERPLFHRAVRPDRSHSGVRPRWTIHSLLGKSGKRARAVLATASSAVRPTRTLVGSRCLQSPHPSLRCLRYYYPTFRANMGHLWKSTRRVELSYGMDFDHEGEFVGC